MPVTFAVSVNNPELFESTFLASPIFQGHHQHQILTQQNFDRASRAYNDAIERSCNDLLVFAHQDIYFPGSWLRDVERALAYLDRSDSNWGVLGSYGKTIDGRGWGYIYSCGRDVIGEPFDTPVPVQTLDEIVLILRKSSGLRFNEQLPHFHFYGADICLSAAQRGMKSYAVSSFCIHNTQQNLVLPKEFYESYRVLKHLWKDCLPIQTTCVRVSKFNVPMYTRRLQEAYLRHIRQREVGAYRLKSVAQVAKRFEPAR